MGSLGSLRMAGIAGIVFAIGGAVAGSIAPIPPSASDPAAKFLEYYTEHRSAILAQGVMNLLLFIPATLFAAGLWRILGARDGNVLGVGAVLAFLATGAIAQICGAGFQALGWLSDGHGLQETSAKELSLLVGLMNQSLFGPIAAFSFASAAVVLSGNGLPRWVGWLGIVTGIVCVAALFGIADEGAFQPFGVVLLAGFIVVSLYAFVLSVVMVRRTD
jgi:hypothetical protein